MAEQSYPHPIQRPYFVHDEIDLRVYINVVLRYWGLIVTIALLTAVGAGVATIFKSMSQVPQYEAVALVATEKEGLAISETVLQQLQSSLAPDLNMNELRDMLSVESIDNTPPIIQLKVRSEEPELAAEIANWWANLFVRAANDVKTINQNQLANLAPLLEQANSNFKRTEEGQLATLSSLLDEDPAAEETLMALESNNNSVLLQAQLNSLTAIYSDLLSQQHEITIITRDIEGFQALLASQPADAPATLADQLSAILLQFKIFNDDSSNKQEAPNDLMLQFSPTESLSHKTAGELLALLDELLLTIQEKSNKIDRSLAQLETDIANTNIALQVEQARMASQLSTERVEIVSQATVPQNPIPVNSRTLTNIALATAVGIMIGLGIAFFIEYWQQEPKPTEEMAHHAQS